MERQRQPTIQPTVPDSSTIPDEICTEIASMCKKNKYGCIGFWMILVMIISIVITILWAQCYFGGSGCCQKPELVGNGQCDSDLMIQTICNYDGGDCCNQTLIGNGNCDNMNNNPTCENYDKGDCRPPNVKEWPECPHNPTLIGDGTCDNHLKTKAECNHDGGDCCNQTLIGNRFCNDINNFETCSDYDDGDCHPPNITDWQNCPHNPKFIGDGICDDHLFKAACTFDGFDCGGK